MENMVETIINMDKKAREMLAKAEESREQARVDIERRKQELYHHYEESLKEIVEMTKSEEEINIEKGKKIVDQKADAIMTALDEKYEAKKENWVSSIVMEVTGEA